LRWLAPLALILLATLPLAAREASVYFTVEKDGALITGLTKKNFHLYEDGELRPFRLAQPEKPASVAVLVEYSRLSWFYFSDIVDAMDGFFQKAPEGNWYALATFDKDLHIRVDFTKLRGKITSSFNDLSMPEWSEVNTYDAVYEMLDRMNQLPGRRVLIVIGSGADTFSKVSLKDVKRKAEQANVTIYGVGAGSMLRGMYDAYLSEAERMDLLQSEAFLRMLADKTGGEAWFPRFEGAFLDVMEGVMQSLAYQYRLVYDSRIPNDGKFHKIRLEAFRVVNDRREDFKTRIREGWRS